MQDSTVIAHRLEAYIRIREIDPVSSQFKIAISVYIDFSRLDADSKSMSNYCPLVHEINASIHQLRISWGQDALGSNQPIY